MYILKVPLRDYPLPSFLSLLSLLETSRPALLYPHQDRPPFLPWLPFGPRNLTSTLFASCMFVFGQLVVIPEKCHIPPLQAVYSTVHLFTFGGQFGRPQHEVRHCQTYPKHFSAYPLCLNTPLHPRHHPPHQRPSHSPLTTHHLYVYSLTSLPNRSNQRLPMALTARRSAHGRN